MAIGEFAEVGDIIREFASDDATVVVGTVLDPDMEGELRVTMVATGMGAEAKPEQPYKVVPSNANPVSYEDLESPTVIRHRRGSGQAVAVATSQENEMEYLDIPAFLRRQAD